MLLEHEQKYNLGMDALVTVCSWNTNGIMVWARMLWSADALGTRSQIIITIISSLTCIFTNAIIIAITNTVNNITIIMMTITFYLYLCDYYRC